MAKERAPSFQFYPRDFVSSRAVSLMTPEERGGYMFLLCHAWDSDTPGILPDDDAVLAQLSGLGKRWAKCRAAIARAFVVDGGRWRQERMIEEREAQQERYERASRGARMTNNKRAQSDTQSAPQSDTQSDTQSVR